MFTIVFNVFILAASLLSIISATDISKAQRSQFLWEQARAHPNYATFLANLQRSIVQHKEPALKKAIKVLKGTAIVGDEFPYDIRYNMSGESNALLELESKETIASFTFIYKPAKQSISIDYDSFPNHYYADCDLQNPEKSLLHFTWDEHEQDTQSDDDLRDTVHQNQGKDNLEDDEEEVVFKFNMNDEHDSDDS